MKVLGNLFLAINLGIASNTISEDSEGGNFRWAFLLEEQIDISI